MAHEGVFERIASFDRVLSPGRKAAKETKETKAKVETPKDSPKDVEVDV